MRLNPGFAVHWRYWGLGVSFSFWRPTPMVTVRLHVGPVLVGFTVY